jgi:hypothetical protein
VWNPKKVTSTFNGSQNENESLGFVLSWNKSAIALDLDTRVPCTVKSILTMPTESVLPSTPGVPIRCFHYIYVPGAVRATKGASAGNGHKPIEVPEPENFVILMGFHLIVDDVAQWTWSTFWWTPQPDVDGLDADRPATLDRSAPWKFFSMAATRSSSHPGDHNAVPQNVFNPYIEGPINNGLISNCLYCHRRAIFRESSQPYISHAVRTGAPPRCAYTRPAEPSSTCPIVTWLDRDNMNDPASYLKEDPNFANSVQTHFLWSLAVHQDPKSEAKSQSGR